MCVRGRWCMQTSTIYCRHLLTGFKQPFGQPSQLIDMICKGEGNLKDK